MDKRTTALRKKITDRGKLEDLFQGLFEAASDAIIISDSTGTVVMVNAQTEALFGYARDELPGQPIESLIPERFRGRHVAHRAGYVSKPRARMMGTGLDLFARRKDGSEFPVDISLSSVQTDDGLLVFTGIRDVSWRKETEQQLRENEARFRAVAETATDAVIIADRHGNIVYFNAAAEHIFGYAADKVIDKPLTLLMPECFHAPHIAGIRRFLATGEARVIGKTVELSGRRSDGDEFPVELSLASWKIGDTVYFTSLLRDITERKHVEQQISALNESLLRRNNELEILNDELEAFSYSVSHDLRAPLRAIDGFSRILLDEHDAALDATGRDYLARVRRATQRMGALIDELLRLSRVSRAELVFDEVDMTELAREVTEVLCQRHPERNVRFDVAPDMKVEADPRLLRVAVENLLDNAWKFTSEREQAQIEFGAQQQDTETVYFVRDNGAGFDMAYADKLFLAFQRLHDATEFQGTGIGLATVQRIIHKHGGRLWAEGSVGDGATFYFTFSQAPVEVTLG
jgi:PAS domain S-box-containing protein